MIFIVGPTAVGKSKIGLALAKQIDGEIISCDAMQVYKEINIVTAKASAKDRLEIPHHLLDIVSVEEEFDVVRFRKEAIKAIDKVHAHGKVPILVGGSGLYSQVLLDGIFEGSTKDEELREQLKRFSDRNGCEALHQKLVDKDPVAAEKIHFNDTRRVIRALEVITLTGQPISVMQKQRDGLWGKFDIKMFCLDMDRDRLYDKINARVEIMFALGVSDEIREIADKRLSCTAERIIGVREILTLLKGECVEEEVMAAIKMNTRRYAKRQLTWFRKEDRLQWIDVIDKTDDEIIREIKENM